MHAAHAPMRPGIPWRAFLFAACLVTSLVAPQPVVGGLKDTVRDLYGGNGITLEPPLSGFSHVPHFAAASLQGLDQLNSLLAPNLSFFAFNSTVAGFKFDPELGVPERTSESLGPSIAERADTLGARTLDVGFAYTRRVFKKLNGTSLDRQSLPLTHIESTGDGRLGPPPAFADFELDQIRVDINLKIEQDVFAFLANYGLMQNLDVGIVIPVIHLLVTADAFATIIDNSPTTNAHFFGPNSDPPNSRGGGEETGIGDILLRAKYNFVRAEPAWPDLAVLGQVKLPTGNEDDLLGTGDTSFLALLIASKRFGPVTPHANVGYEVSTGDSRENNLRYIPGFDVQVHRRLTLALDVLGRWRPDGFGIGDHLVDLVPQVKWNFFRSFLVNANVQVPLNKNEGLRPDFAWTIGISGTF